MNRANLETCVETQLAPTLNPGDVVILDNLSSDKSEKAKAILKARLRRTGARSIDVLWQAVGNICDVYTSDECWNFIKASAYAPD